VSPLASAVVSITTTQRKRFFWAAWWTHTPQASPFTRPDLSNGGARSHAEALAAANLAAGRHLTLIEPHWAHVWNRILRGETPPTHSSKPKKPSHIPRSSPVSAWTLLGLTPGASLDEIKRAFRKRALETHPDQGGDDEMFRAVRSAYERLVARIE
jgi:hypothetical protein